MAYLSNMMINSKDKKENQKYITLQEAAEIYGCTQKHMNLLARQGRLKAKKFGHNWVTTLVWLDEYKNNFDNFNTNNNSKKYISLKEAAKVYGCTERHLSLVARTGKLKTERVAKIRGLLPCYA